MAIYLRFLIALLVISRATNLGIPPLMAAWHYVDAKSQVAASQLSENISALMWSSFV